MTFFKLSDWPEADRAGITGVLTDIDDTLTTDGVLSPDARAALLRLRAAGLPVFAVTGRPAGWSEAFALDWPVDAIVAENGAVALWRGAHGRLCKDYLQDAPTRRQQFERLQQVARHIEATLPGVRRARDSAGRETDIAIDHSEWAQLDQASIDAVVRLMHAGGLKATVSSIHINGWIGEHDKWVGAQWMVRSHLARDLDAERQQWLYVGDSSNDAVMFARLPNSVGVANIARFLPGLKTPPRYLAREARGTGFAEVVHALLAARPPR